MKRTKPYSRQKPAKRLFAGILFFVLLISGLSPAPVEAACCSPNTVITGDPANASNWATQLADFVTSNSWLSTIFTVVNDTLSFFNNLLGPVTKQGFSAVAASVTASNMTVADVLHNKADYDAQMRDYTQLKAGGGQDQANATMPNKTSACFYTQANQKMEYQTGGDLGAAYTPTGTGLCHGTKANCGGPGYAYERMTDRCRLGLAMPGQYGDGYTCTDPPSGDKSYWNRDLNMDAFLNIYQMPLATPCILADGYPSFSGPQGSSSQCRGGASASAAYDQDPTKSKLAWVAAYKWFERLQDDNVSAPYVEGRSLTSTDVAKIDLDLTRTLTHVSARQAALAALWKRTACPAGSDSIAQELGGGSNCHDRQVAVCNALKNDPNTGGADVSGTNGTPQPPASDGGLGFGDNYYLQNCDSDGLSPLMAQYIRTHPCTSGHWMGTVLPNISRDTFATEEFSQKTCPALDNYFREELRAEREELIRLLQSNYASDNSTTNLPGPSRGSSN